MNCAARARTLDATTAQRFGATYTEAKAEIDGVIAGLAAVLTQGGGQPTALPDLEQRMATGFTERKHFCEEVLARLPPQEGDRSLASELVSGVAEPLIRSHCRICRGRPPPCALTVTAVISATASGAFQHTPQAQLTEDGAAGWSVAC